MKKLRLLRIFISSLLTIMLLFIFTDFYRILPNQFSNVLIYFQFIPSLLSLIVKASPGSTGFLLIIILTLFAGRLYCSFICPLGYSQDFFIHAGLKFYRNKIFGYSRNHYFLFYFLLSVSILSFIISGTVLFIWTDPFSIFGRFITYAASYPLIVLNNTFASFLIKRNIFSIHAVDFKISYAGIIFSLSIFSIIMIISFLKGRLYCNSICPVGAVLSIISRFSFLRIQIKKDDCLQCGKCERICKSCCIDFKKSFVDTGRCVSCFNCLSVCPNGSISLSRNFFYKSKLHKTPEKKNKEDASISRLTFLTGLFLIPGTLSSEEKDKTTLYFQEPDKQKTYKRIQYSSPPGSASIELFNSRCTACSLCISACPTSVLQPAVMHYGLHGIMQPFMDYNSGFCNYDCTTCGDICPADAIKKLTPDEKKTVQTGKSIFIIENCITYTNGTDCGACSEHCPTKAVHMVPFKQNLVIPEVNTDICTGCGACEYACPVRPLKAIYVEGNKKHLSAKLPEIKPTPAVKDSVFPF